MAESDAARQARQVAEALLERGETLAVAESATGGLILSLLTDVAGASGWLRGGIVAYTNDAKRTLLGVPAETLAVHGAVSDATALAMAHGARRLFESSWALGETGVAGPQTGRRSAKPAGLTYLALCGERAGRAIEESSEYLLADPGDRAAVKLAFAVAALARLSDALRS